MKYKTGVFLMIFGAVLMLSAMSLFLYNRWDALRAESEAAKTALILSERLEDKAKEKETAAEIDGVEYMGILSIPRLGLELPVMSEWSYSGLRTAPGRYSGSVSGGDLVICGHNYKRHFGELKNLESGDSIEFTDIEGSVFCYEVEDIAVLKPTDSDIMLSDKSDAWDLTLFTCTFDGRARVALRCILADEDE